MSLRASVLMELLGAVALISVLSITMVGMLRIQGGAVRDRFEERAAREVASGRLALLEAGVVPLRAGPFDLPPDAPGWDALSAPRGSLHLGDLDPGAVRVSVLIAWTGIDGRARNVELRTTLRRPP